MHVSRIVLLIDGLNLHKVLRDLHFDLDFRELLDRYRERGQLIRAYYFTAVDTSNEFVSIRRLLDWLQYNGYAVVEKPAKHFTDSAGIRRMKRNMDVEIAVTAMGLIGKTDEIILFTGNEEFVPLVHALKDHGIRVEVVSTLKTEPPSIDDALRRAADEFTDWNDLRRELERRQGTESA